MYDRKGIDSCKKPTFIVIIFDLFIKSRNPYLIVLAAGLIDGLGGATRNLALIGVLFIVGSQYRFDKQ